MKLVSAALFIFAQVGLASNVLETRLDILVHRVRGSRLRKSFDPCDIKAVQDLIANVYSGLPSSLIDMDRAYILPTVLFRQQAITLNDFAQFLVCSRESSGVPTQTVAALFKSSKKAILDYHGDFKDRLNPFLKNISLAISNQADRVIWESLISQYWKCLASLLKLVTLSTVQSAAMSIAPYSRAVAVVIRLHSQLMRTSEDILIKACLVLLAKIANDDILRALLASHRKAALLLVKELSYPRGHTLSDLVHHCCILQTLNTYLEGFPNLRDVKVWGEYLEQFAEMSDIFKDCANDCGTFERRLDLLQRQIKAVTMLSDLVKHLF